MKDSTTVGAAARELMLKKPESTDPIEIQHEMRKKYESNINVNKKGSCAKQDPLDSGNE